MAFQNLCCEERKKMQSFMTILYWHRGQLCGGGCQASYEAIPSAIPFNKNSFPVEPNLHAVMLSNWPWVP